MDANRALDKFDSLGCLETGLSRIEHDRLAHGNKARPGEWFLDAYSGYPYAVTRGDPQESGVLTLKTPDCYLLSAEDAADMPATPLTPGEQTHIPVDETHSVSTISELGGALAAEDLIHLTPDTSLVSADVVIRQVGSGLLALPREDWAPGEPSQETKSVPTTSIPSPALFPLPNSAVDTNGADTANATDDTAHLTRGPQQSSVDTAYVTVPRYRKETFKLTPIREWAEAHIAGGGRVLNACAGWEHLTSDSTIVRNDLNESREADLHVDVAELAAHFEESSFDAILFDPPWSCYQSNLRYENNHVKKSPNDGLDVEFELRKLPEKVLDTKQADGSEHLLEAAQRGEKTQIGHSRLAKEGFAYLLKPAGKFLELTFHGTAIPSRLDFSKESRTIFDPLGEGKAVIGSVDKNTVTELSAFGTNPNQH
jgi:hypothetical protein